ncbi:MAG TPA: bifunctional phosphoribosyl-AMP cyclohydrolase/phosphoribosyl-ATP diphosphatase HisIE [Flavobacteriales bacterium]|nr:bifunctional phosphoribosyl-AMP cyclohydrolase/phosphoribosyl-ATP diphosphatase HisIE [Flavobacteriales bacterium]
MGELNFDKLNGLIPAVVQDDATHKVLMVGFMTPEAYQKTVQTRQVTFYSRKNKRLWTKGEQSGNFLNVVRILEDCDHDSLLIYANPMGPVCHKGHDTCFNEPNRAAKDTDDMIGFLETIIAERKKHPSESSYTSKLFARGINKIAQKLGEEAIELVIEAKDNDKELFMGEAADLMYHYLVLLHAKGYSLKDVEDKLRSRYVKK